MVREYLTSMPVISVLLPVHNAMPYLPAAVKSILAQDYGDFEMLALDDASTDDSGPYLDRLDDPRVRVLHLPKQGLTSLLNHGIRESHGSYLARMDADDIAMSSRFGSQVRFLSENPDFVAVGCQAMQIDAGDEPLGTWAFSTDDLSIRYDLMRNMTPLIHPGAMMRRSDVVAVGGYDEEYATAQDRDLWWKLAARGKLANLPDTLLYYRRHAGAVTGTKTKLQMATVRLINILHMRSIGLVENEDEYDIFVKVAAMVASHSRTPPTAGELAAYSRVLGRVLRIMGTGEAAGLARSNVWHVAQGWAANFACRHNLRDWLAVLNELAPPPAPLRIARWAARTMARRASRKVSGLVLDRRRRVEVLDDHC